jgi:hypothetical protein
MKRNKKAEDGSETVFELLEYKKMGPYRAEIQVRSLEEMRQLKREGKLIAVRMIGTPAGKATQRSLAPHGEIYDFDWDS